MGRTCGAGAVSLGQDRLNYDRVEVLTAGEGDVERYATPRKLDWHLITQKRPVDSAAHADATLTVG